LSETVYDEIRKSWQAEAESDELKDLDDSRLTRMGSYLSAVRLLLAETPAEDLLKADLLTQEAMNLEFMLNDLLTLRKRKITNAALAQRRPLGGMTLAEEEFYNRLVRAIDSQTESVRAVLSGMSSSKGSAQGEEAAAMSSSEEGGVEYVSVIFLRSVDQAFVGLDEATYGPFKAGDNALIPIDNARGWLRDGTVARVVIDKLKAHD
jgi:DNA replication initiation complex subunit (GINS family)